MDNCFCDSNFFWFPISINNKGLFTWVWGTPGRWGNLLRWDKKKKTLLYMHYWMVTKHVNKKNAVKPHTMFWWLMLFYTHLRLLLKPSELWLSIATFNNHEKPPPKWILCEFDVSRIRPQLWGLPYLERVTRFVRPGYPPWRVTPPIM